MTRDRKGSRGRGDLSDEDHHLWQHTAASVTRSRRLKPRVHAALTEDNGIDAAGRAQLKHETRIVDHAAAAPPKPHPMPPPSPASARSAAHKAPPLGDFDRKSARRLGSGQVEIEARIDLHGMRQAEAHAALRRFIATTHARGARWVLVITGKGAPAGGRDQRDWDRPWSADDMGSEARGVLRRNVPRWLSEPELRALVVSFTTAAVRHGGEGAFYVHLRNPDRVRR